jgi:hypothetical protein
MDPKNIPRYEREQIQRLQDEIQYHESMKRNHDAAIVKLQHRIDSIRNNAIQQVA